MLPKKKENSAVEEYLKLRKLADNGVAEYREFLYSEGFSIAAVRKIHAKRFENGLEDICVSHHGGKWMANAKDICEWVEKGLWR